MWALTICSLILLAAVVGSVLFLVERQSRVTIAAVTELAETMRQTVEQLIQPVVNPEPIRQIDVPEQTEMYSEPVWEKDWNP